MTFYFVTTNQPNTLNTANGDNIFVAPGVAMNGGIDLRGNGGGDQTVTVYGTLFRGIDDYFASSSGRDQIFIGPTGSVNTNWFGAVNLAGGGHVVVNSGTISAMSYGNAISIYGSVGTSQAERNYVTNTGTISATSLHLDRTWNDSTIGLYTPSAGVTITNTGSILSSLGYAISLDTTDASVINNGFIEGGVRLSPGSDLFDSRRGTITGPILGQAGNDRIYGSTGDDTIVGGEGHDRIDGHIDADVMIGGGGNDVYFVDNSGDVVDEDNATYGGGGNDAIYFSISFDLLGAAQVIGTVETLVLSGSAKLNGRGTNQAETINGNVGKNVLAGNGGNDELNGSAGNDTLLGGEGDDVLLGGDDADRLNGGPGTDQASYADSPMGLIVDLQTPANNTGFAEGDSYISIEILSGSNFADNLRGDAGTNTIWGGIGSDFLYGRGGYDTLLGGDGNDLLVGGEGPDVLTGGTGADRFDFDAVTETGLAAGTLDRITDFVHAEADKIDLSTIDANAALAGNQAFQFIGAGPFVSGSAAGKLRYDAATDILYGSTDADAEAEFSIQLNNLTGMQQSDFVL